MRSTISSTLQQAAWRTLQLATICVIAACATLLGSSSANAAVAGQQSVPAAATVPAKAACSTPIWWSIYQVHADNPMNAGNGQIMGNGYLRMDEDLCGATTHTEVETKVCGAFGCNYESWGQGATVNAHAGYTWTGAVMDCRGGTNRYQIAQHANIPTPGGGAYEIARSANAIEFTC